ncbi:MAG: penicillin-binding protein 2, partial [Deltaproteobacteria bacterium]|nr:penicillin-binding protein 2 [Deltaproteobacteria bacterium]
MRTRIATVAALFAIGFGILLCRALVFHLAPNAKLEKVALRQYRTAVRESTRRGKILDAVGRELAINIQVESLYANPRAITNPSDTATKLARILKLQRPRLEERLRSKRKFEWIKRRLTSDEARIVKALNLPGVFTMHESKRAYPNGKLASTILGAVGLDAEGLAGMELVYDDLLISRSTPGRYARDARGHLYLSPTDVENERRLAHIQLTIDQTLQYIAEDELESGVKSAFARGGVVVAVDPMTGAILAMASTPRFDPNHYADFDPSTWKNRAVTDSFEPGSTLKAMIVAAALDDLRVTPEQVFDCERGEMRIGSEVIHDTHSHGKLSVADIVKVSSNIGAAKIARTFSRQELQATMARFGFGHSLGIELPGEAAGILPRKAAWSELTQATVAFGQGISATPLQMTMAFVSMANGGELLRPGLVKRAVDVNGDEVKVFERQVLSRPLKPETARLMTHLLEAVVKEEGTGTLAASPEYPVAGKTGTAQKVDPNLGVYADGKYY